MDYVNARPFNFFTKISYSTPEIYADVAKTTCENSENFDNCSMLLFPPKNSSDFFPYSRTGAHQYWTGFYSSRASLKGKKKKKF